MASDAKDEVQRAFLEELQALENLRLTYTSVNTSAAIEREDPEVRRLLESMAMLSARSRVASQRNLLATGNVKLLKAESYADVLATVGTARLTVVMGRAGQLWSRLPELFAISPFRLTTFDIYGGESCDVWRQYHAAFCLEDIIECYWRGSSLSSINAQHMQGTRP